MLLLAPASVVALATILRGFAQVNRRAGLALSARVRATVLAQYHRSGGRLSITDARTFAAESALGLYSILQPLPAIYAIAPIVGALGSVAALSRAWNSPRSLQSQRLAEALNHAFIPLGWGLLISLIAIAGYAILRARVFWVEQTILSPAALAALDEVQDKTRGKL